MAGSYVLGLCHEADATTQSAVEGLGFRVWGLGLGFRV